jgi:surface protein
MLSMFHNATVFNGDITTWNTGAVTDMRKMFFEAPVFNQDIRGWDTSNVTTMQETFRSAAAFNQPIGSWDTSSVTDMQYMFYGATAFDQDLSSWNVAGVTNMTQMFDSVTLSTANYDALLVGWESQAVQSGVTFDGGGSQYTSGSAAATARQALIDDHGWIITDGGSAP